MDQPLAQGAPLLLSPTLRHQWAYAHYTRSREWARELRPLPGLLIVTPDLAQEQRIQRIAQTCAEAGFIVYTTTAIRLERQRLLDPIWLTTLPDRRTHFDTPCWMLLCTADPSKLLY
jgi:hypothetical protein